MLKWLMKWFNWRNERFKKHAASKNVVFQMKTFNDSIVRHYIIEEGRIRSKGKPHPEPGFTVKFENPDYGYTTLTSKRQDLAFMQGIQDKKIMVEGDLKLFMWFQQLMMSPFKKDKPKN